MKRLLWCLAWAVWWTALEVGAQCVFNCTKSPACTCTRTYSHYEMFCSDPKTKNQVLSAKVQPEGFVEIQCDTKDSRDLNSLAGLVLCPVNMVVLKECPPPPVSYRQLMDSMGVGSTEMLVHKNFMLDGRLNASHLANLSFVSKLRLPGTGLGALPEDLLSGVPLLKTLDLQDNRVRLPEGFFRRTPDLTYVELGNNYMTVDALGNNPFVGLESLKHLNLWSNNLWKIRGEHFQYLGNLNTLDLSTNNLRTLDPSLFKSLTNLTVINLSSNYLSRLPSGLFETNRKLDSFQMNHNREPLEELGAGLFANMSSLKVVIIESSVNFTFLPEDLFWGSEALLNVSFKNNKISSVPARLFQDSRQLIKLDLSNNLIQELPDSLFSVTTKLVYLNLSRNRLQTISGTVFGKLTALEELHLSNNQLRQIASEAFLSLKKLKKACFAYNELQRFGSSDLSIPYNSYLSGSTDLSDLNLSHNNISCLYQDWAQSKTQLRTLDLSYNNLAKIEGSDLVRFISRPLDIDLSRNRIETIDLSDLESSVSARESNVYTHKLKVKLGDNPLNCDCFNYHLIIYLNDGMSTSVYKTLEITDAERIKCSRPDFLKGEQIKLVDESYVSCDYSSWEGCPSGCSCSYKPHNMGLLLDCSSLGEGSTIPRELLPPPDTPQRPINHTELDLSYNRLSYWPDFSGPGFANLTVLDLSHNDIALVNVNTLPPRIEELMLDNNRLTRMEDDDLKSLRDWPTLRKLTLHNNSWTCDCNAVTLLDFIHNAPQVSTEKSNIRCSDGSISLPELSDAELCYVVRLVWGIVGGTFAFVALMVGICFALYYRYQNEVRVWLYAHKLCLWLVTEEELDRNKVYDAFISYAHQDEDFVVNKLVPGLEEEGPTKFKLCLHFRDWIVGDFIPNQIARSVEESKRTIVVLSKSFVESVWGKMEFRTAHSQALSEGRARVIIVLYGEVDTGAEMDPELKAYLSTNTYLKWGDPWFWDRLRYALPHPPKVSHKKQTNNDKNNENKKNRKKKMSKEQPMLDKTALVEEETLVTLPAPGGRVLVDIRRTDPV